MRQPERMFLFRLARELGKTVGELLDLMDSREISDWMAFFRAEADLESEREREAKKIEMQAALSGMAAR